MLYALFYRPDAFQRYISGSGDLYIAVPYVIQHGAQLAARNGANPIHTIPETAQPQTD